MNEESSYSSTNQSSKGYITRLAIFAVFRCLVVCGLAAWILQSEFFLNKPLPVVRFPIEMAFTGAAIYIFLEIIVLVNMYQDSKPISKMENNQEISLGAFCKEVANAVRGDKIQ